MGQLSWQRLFGFPQVNNLSRRPIIFVSLNRIRFDPKTKEMAYYHRRRSYSWGHYDRGHSSDIGTELAIMAGVAGVAMIAGAAMSSKQPTSTVVYQQPPQPTTVIYTPPPQPVVYQPPPQQVVYASGSMPQQVMYQQSPPQAYYPQGYAGAPPPTMYTQPNVQVVVPNAYAAPPATSPEYVSTAPGPSAAPARPATPTYDYSKVVPVAPPANVNTGAVPATAPPASKTSTTTTTCVKTYTIPAPAKAVPPKANRWFGWQ